MRNFSASILVEVGLDWVEVGLNIVRCQNSFLQVSCLRIRSNFGWVQNVWSDLGPWASDVGLFPRVGPLMVAYG